MDAKKIFQANSPNWKSNEQRLQIPHINCFIFTFGKLKFCLICKITLTFSTSSSSLESHISSDEHKLNLLSLFKQCRPVQNPTWECEVDEKYKFFCNNVFPDFSTLNSKLGFISGDKENITCWICNVSILSLVESKETLLNTIRDHLSNETHLLNVQGYAWICPTLSNTGFLKLNKTSFFCSLCHESTRGEQFLVSTAMNHLQIMHPEVSSSHDLVNGDDGMNIVTDSLIYPQDLSRAEHASQNVHGTNSNIDGQESQECYGISASSSKLNLESDERSAPGKGIDIQTNPFTNKLDSVSDQLAKPGLPGSYLFICIECGENIEVVGNDYEKSIQHHSINHSKENPSEIQHGAESTNSIKCNLCGDMIEILNDIDFSMQSHLIIKHQDVDNSRTRHLIYDDNINYACPQCNQLIKVFNKNLDMSIEIHNQEKHPKDLPLFTSNDRCLANEKFLLDVFDCLPEICKGNLEFIEMKPNAMYCGLCNSAINIVESVFETSMILNDHFSTNFHKNQYGLALEVKKLSNHNTSEAKHEGIYTNYSLNTLLQSLMNAVFFLDVNKEFIHKRDVNFICILCESTITNSTIQEELVHNFNLHFASPKHKCNYDLMKRKLHNAASTHDSETGVLLESLSKSVPFLSLNKHFLLRPDANFICSLCDRGITYSLNRKLMVQNFNNHFTSSEHKSNYDQNKKQLNSILDCLTNYVPLMQANAPFLHKLDTNFVCSLCNKGISYSPDMNTLACNFDTHFKSKDHKYNYDLTKKKSKQSLSSPNSSSPHHESSSFPETHIKAILDSIEDLVPFLRINKQFMEINNDNFNCSLCKTNIKSSLNKVILAHNFNAHFDTAKHKLAFKSFVKGNPKTYDANSKTYQSSRNEEQFVPSCSTSTYLINEPTVDLTLLSLKHMVPLLEKYKNIISKPSGKHYFCILCFKGINYSPNKATLAKNFNMHFESSDHIKCLNPMPESTFNMLKNYVPMLGVNKKYISKPDIHFFCRLCLSCINHSPDIQILANNFNMHFKSRDHKEFFDKYRNKT